MNDTQISENPSEVNEQVNLNDEQHKEETRKKRAKIMKIGLLVVLLTLLIIIIFNNFSSWMLTIKSLVRIKTAHQMEQISGLDEDGYVSYYYYKLLVDKAKKQAKQNSKKNINNEQVFENIEFDQLYGVFKILKAIQHAKNYSTIIPKQLNNETYYTADPEVLDAAYNYTQYFDIAANQYQCASCYSFPITATIQFLYKYHKNITIKLSEQQLIDCSRDDDFGNGCNDGNITQGFEYAMRVGLVSERDYPYRSKNGKSFPCNKEIIQNEQIKKYKIDGFRMLPEGDCEAIQYELSQGRTVATMMAHGQLGQYTSSTKRAFRNCPKRPFSHAITIVGQTEQHEWIVRNSWGSSWGKNGYFIMKGGDTCGVCEHAIVPYFNSNKKQGNS